MKLVSLSLTVLLTSVLSVWAARPGFERYEPIAKRSPFGIDKKLPPGPVIEKIVPPAPLLWPREYRMTSIKRIDNRGLSVGLVELKSQRSILLEVGERDGDSGLELIIANYEKEEAVFKLGGREATLSMLGPAPTVTASPTAGSRKQGFRKPPQPFRGKSSTRTRRLDGGTKSLSQARLTGKELKEHLQRYNEFAIEAGMPALPVQLTKKADERLVEKGILPPRIYK